MTDREKEIIKQLNHTIYTVEFMEEWLNRNDNVLINAPSALQSMGAKGYYEAVKQMAKELVVEEKDERHIPKKLIIGNFENLCPHCSHTWQDGNSVCDICGQLLIP